MCVEFSSEVSLDNNQQEDTVEIPRRTKVKKKHHFKTHESFFHKSCLIALPPSPTSSHHCGSLARTLPSLTCHHVTLAFVLPSRLPWLIVVLALVAPFLSHRCLSTCSLRLLPPIRLLFSLSGCCITSYCTSSTSLSLLLCHCLSLTCQLVVALLLVAPPPPCVSSPQATASCNAPASCHVASHHATLLFAWMKYDPQYGGNGAQARGN
jgi:hypothetical protein